MKARWITAAHQCIVFATTWGLYRYTRQGSSGICSISSSFTQLRCRSKRARTAQQWNNRGQQGAHATGPYKSHSSVSECGSHLRSHLSPQSHRVLDYLSAHHLIASSQSTISLRGRPPATPVVSSIAQSLNRRSECRRAGGKWYTQIQMTTINQNSGNPGKT